MVTIWPSFIRCLMTSEALTDILCARSATEMVSGMCTSCAWNSVGTDEAARRTVVAVAAATGARRPPAGPTGTRRAARRCLEGALLGGIVGPARRKLLRLDRLLVARLGRTPVRPRSCPGAPTFLWIVPLIASLAGLDGLDRLLGLLGDRAPASAPTSCCGWRRPRLRRPCGAWRAPRHALFLLALDGDRP